MSSLFLPQVQQSPLDIAVLWKVGVSLQQDYCLLALQVTSFIGIPW